MFGKAQRALDRIASHEEDCAEERERSKEFRVKIESKLDSYHEQNREAIRGIYRMLWSALVGIVLMLISVVGWVLTNSLTFKVSLH